MFHQFNIFTLVVVMGYLMVLFCIGLFVVKSTYLLFLNDRYEFCDRYVPTHLHLMVFELVKNSLRAVQERFMDSDKIAPPIRIIVADGIEDVTIKVLYCCSVKCTVHVIFMFS